MSQLAVIIPEDEFGGLDWIGLPGQDPDMIRTMIETLTADVKPQNVIERCWIRDIAILTARMNFMRRAHWMIMAAVMEEIAIAEAKEYADRHDTPVEVEEDLLALVRRMASGENVPEASQDRRIVRLIGKALRQNLGLSQSLMQMEAGIARERDRLFNLYEMRKLAQRSETAEMFKLMEEMGFAHLIRQASETSESGVACDEAEHPQHASNTRDAEAVEDAT